MKKNNLKRFLASLLAVLMLSQVTGVAPGVFADNSAKSISTYEANATPQLITDAGTIKVTIKDNYTLADVKEALAQKLLSNYSELTKEQIAAIDWQYECVGKAGLLSNTAWGSINGFTSKKTLTYTHPALVKQADQETFKVAIGNDHSKYCTIQKVAKQDSAINVKTEAVDVVIPFTDATSVNNEVLKQRIFDAVVVGTTPNLTYSELSYSGDFSEGQNKAVTISYAGNDDYYGISATAYVNFVDARTATSVTIKPDTSVKIPYTQAEDGTVSIDFTQLRQNIFDNAVVTDPELTVDDVVITYNASRDKVFGGTDTKWVALEGEEENIAVKWPEISEGDQQIRVSYVGSADNKAASTEATVNFVGREASSISFSENPVVKITYNDQIQIDFDKLYEAIWNNVVEGTTPELKREDVKITYYAKSTVDHDWMPLEGGKGDVLTYPAISEGTQKIRFEFAGNANYTGFSQEVSVEFKGREEVKGTLNDNLEVGITFKDDQTIDYDALEQAIWDAAVDGQEFVPELAFKDITVEYKLFDIVGKDIWAPLSGSENLNVGAISADEVHQVRFTWGGNKEYKPWSAVINVTVSDNRIQSEIATIAGASITYNMSADVMRNAILNNAIDWTASSLPALDEATSGKFVIEYYATAQLAAGVNVDSDVINAILEKYGHEWVPIEGKSFTANIFGKDYGIIYPQMGAGEQQIRIKFVGNAEYKPCDAVETTLNVAKADVKITVKSQSIYPNEVPSDDFITLDPNDPAINVYVIYGGITSNLSGSIYLQLPDEQQGLIQAIDNVQKLFGTPDDQLFSKRLQEGITVGELKDIFNTIINAGGDETAQAAVRLLLKQFGVDYDTLKNVMNALNKLPSLGNNVKVALGSPNHAGLYLAVAVTDNPNYNTAVGTGVLTVKMRASGMKIHLNDNFSKKMTVEDAKALAEAGVATLQYNGEDVSNPNLHYLYTGIQSNFKPYSSTTTFPTEPGRYVVTIVTLGGDYLAAPVTKTFQITK